MKLLSSTIVSRVAKSAVLCAGVLLASTSFSEARTVSVYLTSKRFGDKQGFVADSGTRTIQAATQYSYKLDAQIRGQSGKPIEKIVKPGTDIASFVELVSPGGSKFLSGTYSNAGGTLPVTLLNKKFAGTKKVKGLGTVSFSFVVIGKIDAGGKCSMEVKSVKITSSPSVDLGDVIFMKGSKLDVSTVP